MMTRNRLGDETSPYLLQHKDNPVHWRAWGQDALDEAKATGKPILLSVGYAACHWCHVMAHESFEDDSIAALMNELYIPIKVDREERPDIDAIYQHALSLLGQQGGWPLTMFLTPEGAPFWGGTYFPPEPRWGRPSFRQVLTGVAEAYRDDNAAIARNTGALADALAALSATRPGGMIGPDLLGQVSRALLQAVDRQQGGLRGAPKFPNPPIFRLFWQEASRTGDPIYATAVHELLRHMSQGGIYDHLGGGYARYSTDAEWLVPHFEKMLYDNAQILDLLALAHTDRPSPLYTARAEETVGWLLRDMATEGAFAASEDADSEGEEGRFYVWTEAEIDALLGPDATAFKANYDVTAGGNWEGHTILRRTTPLGASEEPLARARRTLLEARARRVRPGRDDKVLIDWNALAIAALCRAAIVFERPDWLTLATSTFDILHGLAAADGRVPHAWRHGRITAAGLLEDQATLARAALALFEAMGDPRRLDQASRLADAAHRWFADTDGSYFTAASDAEDVPMGPAARPRTAADNATPSGNGIMAEVLARLFHLTGEAVWATRAEAVIRAFSGKVDMLASCPSLLAAADLLQRGACVVVIGEAEPSRALCDMALRAPDPAICVLRLTDARGLPEARPAYGKSSPGAYVCRNQTCSLPTTSPADLAELL